jgi:[methyl-Co(III) methanol-specific corrinoid protein]:coenzyme M methyltransferase
MMDDGSSAEHIEHGPSPRERLLRALEGKPTDRPPVICPGGMMTMATQSAMEASGSRWPEAHADAEAMAKLVLATQEETSLECLSVPFCMTVEAEALGCAVDLGDETVLPHVTAEVLRSPGDVAGLPAFSAATSGRCPVVLEALGILRAAGLPLPVIGAVVGPVSLAAMVMEAGLFLRLTRRDPPSASSLVSSMAEVTLSFALAQREAGADCVMIAEPTATGEVMGGKHFAALARPALHDVLRALRDQGIPTILHICGDLRPLLGELRELMRTVGGPLAISVDAMVSGRVLREGLPGCVTVGNVDAVLLERGTPAQVGDAARRAAREFQVVSPACGIVPTTPAANLRAFVRAVADG